MSASCGICRRYRIAKAAASLLCLVLQLERGCWPLSPSTEIGLQQVFQARKAGGIDFHSPQKEPTLPAP